MHQSIFHPKTQNLSSATRVPVGGEGGRLMFARQRSCPSHDIVQPDDGLYILLTTQLNAKDASLFRIAMERPHFNLVKKTPAQLQELFRSGLVLVSRHLDPAGRQAVAFCHLRLSRKNAAKVVNRLGWASGASKQYQPYLFDDNIRNEFYKNDKTGLAEIDTRLLLYLVETEQGGLTVQYSARDEGRPRHLLRSPRVRNMLLRVGDVPGSLVRHHQPGN